MQERRARHQALSRPPAPADAGDDRGRQRPRHPLLVAVVVVTAVAVDQITKAWAVAHLATHTDHVIGTLDLQLQRNSGSAFSLFTGHGAVFIAVAACFSAGFAAAALLQRSRLAATALAMVAGGAVGNMADRVFRSGHASVVDFIALHFWPTFNVADSCIVVGAALAAWSYLRIPRGTEPEDDDG